MDTDLALLLSQASYVLATELTLALAVIGITPRLFSVLRAALDADRTQSQVAAQCALDKTTMVVTMDALERAGLAERKPSPHDRRARIIAVTPAGAELVAKAEQVIGGIYKDVLASLPGSERAAFVAGLTRLAQGRLSTPVPCEKPPRRRAARVPQSVN